MRTFEIRGRCASGARIDLRITAHSQDEAVELFAQTVPEVLQTIAATEYGAQEVRRPETNPVVRC